MESGCGCDACCDCGQDFRRIQLHRPNSAFIDGQRFLYAANFTKGRVDVYDNAFHLVDLSKQHFDEDSADQEDRHSGENSFADEKLPRSYVPFNVQAIGNDIVVTYVLREEGSGFEAGGPGLGFVDIYSSTGRLLRRLEHGDWLNAPWGVALAPLDFGRFSHDLLIGQFAGGGTLSRAASSLHTI